MTELQVADAHERLTADERDALRRELLTLGWVYVSGTSGAHRAERLGTRKYEQASTTAHGLLEAVRKREAELRRM